MAEEKKEEKKFPNDPKNCSHNFELRRVEDSHYPGDDGVKTISLVECQGCGKVKPMR